VSKKFLLLALTLGFVLALAPFALAQDDTADDDAADDDAADDDVADDDVADPFTLTGTANGNAPPLTLEANTAYEFAFDVFNASGGAVAIKKVDITLPSVAYVLDTANLHAPDALHPDNGSWAVDFDDISYTITWEFSGVVSSVEVGDIKEGEMLTFSFMATTDADATDGFAWVLTGDDQATTMVSDTFYFGDDDETPPDDDTSPTGDDDDDDDSGGCGC
jgi:hypothetical protein